MRALCLLAWLVAATACSGTSTPEFPDGPLSVALVLDADTQQPVVRITGWSSTELDALRAASIPQQTWDRAVHVSVSGHDDISIAGQHRVTPDAVEMVPRFSLDRGREYIVRVNPALLSTPRLGDTIETRVQLPAVVRAATTYITHIYPSSGVWPENILRFYLHFSAPMSGTSAVGHVRLQDDQGDEIPDALLEVDVDLWNDNYTRRTVFFDPGRVKRGIRPNVELGRALVAGRRYSIVVTTAWRDGQGQPLAQEFRHTFTAGPPIERPVDPSSWTMTPPASASRDPLVVRFPWALDAGLLHRALGVATRDGQPVDGQITVGPEETSWAFTPTTPWRDAPHALVVLTLLEDPSGNKVGQAFEFEMLTEPRAADAERITIPFRPR